MTSNAATSVAALTIPGARVVVTGAASGIGAALAGRLVAEGARVLINDSDAATLALAADRLGVDQLAGDASDPASVQQLVDTAIATMGGVDLFCANAGVAQPGSLDPQPWELAWQVNVMAHVHAARCLLPGWLAARKGRFLATVSAAGLLTMLGNAQYSATKHAALAFAEWLRMTYSHRGITVQALCPQGVSTPLLERADPRSAAILSLGTISADAVADAVLQGLSGDEFLILPHPEVAEYAANRAADPDRWLASMNRLQQRLEATIPVEGEL